MTKTRFLTAAVAVLVLAAAAATAARAEDTPAVAFNAGVASDYVFRGVSQTMENPEVFAGVDATAGRFYAGAWASNVDFGDSTDAEIDVYAGFKPTLGPVTLDLGVIHYGYVNAPSGAHYGNWEAKLAASVAVGKATLGGAVFYSPDSFGAAEEAVYYEANGSLPVTKAVSISGAVGRQTYDGPGDYTTWNLGATWAFASHFSLDARYIDTDEHGFGDIYGSRAVATLKATF
ncbi:MAG: hypothetical protein JWP35_701 [Caulobacter sp.]|nr:hypothetical protein [Caulobacter sp.]